MLSFYIEDNNWICRGGLLVDEKRYIQYRKIKAFGNKLCFYICRVFPIKRNLISVCTFEGKGGFGCNPKYIVQELHRKNPDYKFVWLVDNIRKEFPDYIKKVPNTLWTGHIGYRYRKYGLIITENLMEHVSAGISITLIHGTEQLVLKLLVYGVEKRFPQWHIL